VSASILPPTPFFVGLFVPFLCLVILTAEKKLFHRRSLFPSIHRSEVMSVSGVLDNMPDYLDDHVQNTLNFRDRCLTEANKFRVGCRETLKKEKLAGLGFAAGAFVAMAI
jgi:ABC-type microcin C transport system permease subunit YejE